MSIIRSMYHVVESEPHEPRLECSESTSVLRASAATAQITQLDCSGRSSLHCIACQNRRQAPVNIFDTSDRQRSEMYSTCSLRLVIVTDLERILLASKTNDINSR